VTFRGADGRIRTGDDHLLTLITCDRTYGGADGRFCRDGGQGGLNDAHAFLGMSKGFL